MPIPTQLCKGLSLWLRAVVQPSHHPQWLNRKTQLRPPDWHSPAHIPAAQGCCQSCRHWDAPPALRRPRCLRWEGRCHWTHPCRAPAARPPQCGWSHGWFCGRCSHRTHCSTGRAPKGHPPACACRWQSSRAGWCGTWGARMWCQRLFLWGEETWERLKTEKEWEGLHCTSLSGETSPSFIQNDKHVQQHQKCLSSPVLYLQAKTRWTNCKHKLKTSWIDK